MERLSLLRNRTGVLVDPVSDSTFTPGNRCVKSIRRTLDFAHLPGTCGPDIGSVKGDVSTKSIRDSAGVQVSGPLYSAIGRRALSQWLEAIGLDGSLPPRAKALAMALAARLNHKDGRLCPSLAVLGSDTGMSESTILAAIRDLEDAGLLSRSRRTTLRTNGPEKLSNAYRIIPPKSEEPTLKSGEQNESLSEPPKDNLGAGDSNLGEVEHNTEATTLAETPLPAEPSPETVASRRRELQSGTVTDALRARDRIRETLGVDIGRAAWKAHGFRADPVTITAVSRLWAGAEMAGRSILRPSDPVA